MEMEGDRSKLPQNVRWRIADDMAEDILPVVNRNAKEVHLRDSVYSKYIKRLFDILIALVVLILTSPINLIIGIITFFDVGRPIFFLQERVGKDGKIFKVIKFRNMRNTVDEKGELLPASERVTKWGKWVRRCSLDELLNFVSVLKGDMSIIGPRPLVPQYYHRYSSRHLGRYHVKPGLECPPHTKEHAIRSWHGQFENDIWYVENLSFKTDIQMIFNLIRFTFDRRNSAIRSAAKRGDFIGYSPDGTALGIHEVPTEYVERACREMNYPGGDPEADHGRPQSEEGELK